MKKFFALVLVILTVSLCGCSKPAKEETTSTTTTVTKATTTTTQEIIFTSEHCLGRISDKLKAKQPLNYGGVRMAFYEDIFEGTKELIYSQDEEERPIVFTIMELSHPTEEEGFCQFDLSFKEKDIKSIVLGEGKQYLFLKGYSLESISNALEEKRQSIEDEKFGFSINKLEGSTSCYEVNIWK